uniref:Phlebovirus glycoprotein G2 fusion domain-containing protein n=1 Tax=Caenorhabditis japonica TaxID=281687 RepID=A0A8R1HIN0_CAEJA
QTTDLPDLFNTINRILPAHNGHWRIQNEGSTVSAVISEEVSTEVSMRIKEKADVKIVRDTDKCWIQAEHVIGCYACAAGSRAEISCFSQNNPTIANVKCGRHMYAVPCSPSGQKSTLRFFSDTAQFRQTCAVECGQETTEFEVNGILKYTGSIWTSLYRIINGNTTMHDEVNLPDFSHLTGGFLTFFKTGIMVMVTVAIIFLTTYVTIFSCCASVIRRGIWMVVKLPIKLLFKSISFVGQIRGQQSRYKAPRHIV